MKKYLYLMMVAIFAAMSFSLTACGDDNDEPDGNGNNSGKASCSLTIEGKKFPAKRIASEIWEHNGVNYLTVWVNDITDGDYFIFETPDDEHLSHVYEGANVTDDCNVDFSFGDIYCLGAYDVVSGSVTISKFDRAKGSVTVTFNNAVFEDPSGDTYKVNGSFTSPIKGADNKTKL